MYIDRMFCTQRQSCNFYAFLLAFLWTVGLLSGGCVAFANNGDSLFITALQPSLFQVLFLSLLPLWLSAIGLYVSPAFLYPIVFAKAFSFGFSSVIMIVTCGSYGWLIRGLIMFPGICSLFILWLFWLTQAMSGRTRIAQRLLLATTAITATALLNFYLITPVIKQSPLFF